MLEGWIADYLDWQSVRHVDPRVDMDGLVRSLWSVELGLGVMEAQGALDVAPENLANFVAAFLETLENTDGPRRSGRTNVRRASGHRVDLPGAPTTGLTPVWGLRDSPRAVATQSRLIDVARRLFTERGYASVTVRDIARAASMTTGSIYGNFSNKANLLVEVIEARITQDLEQLPLELIASGSPADLVEFNFANSADRTQLRALLVQGAAEARADAQMQVRLAEVQRRRLTAWGEGLQGWVQHAPAQRHIDTTTAVTVAWCAELGLGLMEALDLVTPAPDALAVNLSSMFRVAGLDRRADEGSARARTRP
jgi:AcrR family transcriptional regulator